MPGQTGRTADEVADAMRASMEGRAIARPNDGRGSRGALRLVRFNGGPGNCPAKQGWAAPGKRSRFTWLQWRAGQLPGQTTDANSTWVSSESLQWRAGQLPGQTTATWLSGNPMTNLLQWRAGQLPGQTRVAAKVLGWTRLASMEGRAIARPNCGGHVGAGVLRSLQWRAGQLPGQTMTRMALFGDSEAASMEGRAIARPNLASPAGIRNAWTASMEGRAIARPNTR